MLIIIIGASFRFRISAVVHGGLVQMFPLLQGIIREVAAAFGSPRLQVYAERYPLVFPPCPGTSREFIAANLNTLEPVP
jgi:hypothetical protein